MPTQADIARAFRMFSETTGGRSPSQFESDFMQRTGYVPTKAAIARFGSGGGGSSSSFPSEITTTMRQEVVIPDFLKPIIEDQAERTRIGNRALEDLERYIKRTDLVPNLNADQLRSLEMARGVADSDALRNAINVIQRGAEGEFVRGGEGVSYLENLVAGRPTPLNIDSEGFRDAYGVALRQQAPRIASQFALAGRTGSGLSQVAREQAAVDAFGRLFNAERQRQLSGAQSLASMYDAGRARQLSAAQALPDALLAPSRIIGNVGDVLQTQATREKMIPLQARQALAGAAAGSAIPVNVGALTGTTTTQTQPVMPPSIIRTLQAAGIDPRSGQGQDIIIQALTGQQPSSGGGSDFLDILGVGLGIASFF